MSLPLETPRELVKLSGFHKKGALLERHFDALKKHVMAGNCIGKDNWETMDLTLELGEGGVFHEDEWTKQIDGKVRDITNSAAASRSTQTDDALRARLHHHHHHHHHRGRASDQQLLRRVVGS